MSKTYEVPKQPMNVQTLLAIFPILGLTLIVGFLYGIVIAVSPLVYINYFITLAFGLILGYGVRMISKLFKILDRKVIIGFSAAAALIGLYLSWVTYILFLMYEGDLIDAYFKEYLITFQPLALFETMIEINRFGAWTFFGAPVNGWVLTIIWLIEAGIILWVPTQLALNQKRAPFSVSQNKWYKKQVLQKDFASIFRKSEFLEQFKENCVETIHSLENGKAMRFSRVSVFYLRGESNQYVSVENVSRDRHGKRETLREVITLYSISSKEAKTLMDAYHAKEAFIFDY